MRKTALRPMFVEYVPETLDDGMLYVSLANRTVVHKCCCGCGSEVVTPLDPTQWKLIYDGRVSLEPSVGSWNLPCRSHYWIRQDAVVWAEWWSEARIAAARESQRQRTEHHYPSKEQSQPAPGPAFSALAKSLWEKLWIWSQRR